VRLSDELPLLQERLPDTGRAFHQKAAQLHWEDPETLELAVAVWSRLKKGASLLDLQRDVPRCSYWIYRTIATLLDSGQVD
jgi:hypothetical protein